MGSAVPLPPDVLIAIVDRFGARAADDTGEYTRFPLHHCTATARRECPGAEAESDAFEVKLLDLTLRGIGFRTRVPVVPGTLLTVELDIPGLQRQTWHCCVVHVDTFSEGYYRAGALFCVTGNA